MHRILAPITAFAFICLLAIQMSGFHSHVELDGSDAGLHGAHVHHTGHDEHDHGAEIDVPLLEELGVFSAKLIPLLLTFTVALLAIVWIRHSTWPLPILSGKGFSRVRWRPPLRAPPLSQ